MGPLNIFRFPDFELGIVERIQLLGYEAFFVGGCIRNVFLGKTPKDYDITTNMPYDKLRKHFISEGYSFHTGGANFLTAFINGVEVAQYRKEYNIDGTQSGTQVEPVNSIEKDLSRRDFTMNAVAFDPFSHRVVDPFNGINDIENKIIKFVGNPLDRLLEDSLRLMRGLRFRSEYDLIFDGTSIEAILSDEVKEHFIKTVAFERIRDELIKTFSVCDKLWKFFNPLIANGLLFYIFPSLKEVKGLPGGRYHPENVLEHCIYCCQGISKKFPLLRFAGLLHDVGKGPAAKEIEGKGLTFFDHEKLGLDYVEHDLDRLKFSHREFKYIYNLIKYHMRMWTPDMTPKATRRLNSILKDRGMYYPCLLRLRLADNNANRSQSPYPVSRIKGMLHKLEGIQCETEYNTTKLQISGNDIISLGYPRGEIIGLIICLVKEAIEDEEIKNDRDEILNFIQTNL